MTQPIGNPMSATLPTVGVDAGPGWATALNTFLTEVKGYVENKLGNASLNVTDADIKHGTRTVYYDACVAQTVGATFTAGTSQYWAAAGAGDTVTFALDQAVNERITAVAVYGRANGATAWTWKLYTKNLATGVVTQVGSTQTSATAAAIEKKQIASLTQTIGSDTVLIAEWTSGAAANRCYGLEVQFDKVATP